MAPPFRRKDKEPRMWLMPVSDEANDYLVRQDHIDRVLPRTFKFMPGDEVFLYLKLPVSAVLFRMEITDTDMPLAEVDDSAMLWNIGEITPDNVEYYRPFRMEKREYFDPDIFGDRLSLANLKDNGLTPSMILSVVGEKREILRSLTTLLRPPTPAPPKTISDYYRIKRQDSNYHIERLRETPMGKTKDSINIAVVWRKGGFVQNKSANTTFFDTIQRMGYQAVEKVGLLYKDKYPLVSRTKLNSLYQQYTGGWYIIDNVANTLKAIYINKLADTLGIDLYAELTEK